MAVKLRLKRMGSKQRPFYRIVAADSRSPRDGKFIEVVGTYHPINKENNVTLDEEKILKWLGNGAVPTDTVKNILSNNKVWAKFKTPAKKSTKAKEEKNEVKTTVEKTPAKKTTTTKKTTAKKSEK